MTMKKVEEHWRWNSNITWHYFCSTQYESYCAATANNDFSRYHHLRSCIYFAVGTVEAFLNQEMRRYLESQKKSENEILKFLRNGSIGDKLSKWPSMIYGHAISLDQRIFTIFEEYKEIRHEITHPKRRDHAIYYVLDSANSEILLEAITAALVAFHAAGKTAFPYWMLGWNYVGMNGNPTYPMESNNLNGFYWSLLAMGVKDLGPQDTFEKTHMASLENYRFWRQLLATYPHDIEPFDPSFPSKPKLTRRWWDHEFLIAEEKKNRESGQQ